METHDRETGRYGRYASCSAPPLTPPRPSRLAPFIEDRPLTDMLVPAAYVYRLCLEYARLWSDDREKMSFSL